MKTVGSYIENQVAWEKCIHLLSKLQVILSTSVFD